MSHEPAHDDHVAHGTYPRRVLLELPGEVFGGGAMGPDPGIVSDAARQVTGAIRAEVQVSVVIGGGSSFRNVGLSSCGTDRARTDRVGMLGIVMNALALQGFIERTGVPACVQIATTMGRVAEPHIPLRVIRHMEKNRVVISGAGIDLPYFSTGTVSARHALETHCGEPLMSKNGVGDACTIDPCKNPDIWRLNQLTYERVLADGLQVADVPTFVLYRGNGLTMRVFGIGKPGNTT